MSLDNLQNMIIGAIIFVVMITGGVAILGVYYASDSTIDPDNQLTSFNKTIASSTTLTSDINKFYNSTAVAEDSGAFGWFDILVHSGYNALKAIGNSVSFINEAMGQMADIFDIPPTYVYLASLITLVIVGFAIWGAIMKV
jgi:hypothetical protein